MIIGFLVGFAFIAYFLPFILELALLIAAGYVLYLVLQIPWALVKFVYYMPTEWQIVYGILFLILLIICCKYGILTESQNR